MDNKPIVTCHGDQTLFAKLKDSVTRGLPRETVDWKRSYGRPCRTIHVEVNFVPFNPDILPADDEWTLLGRPFFHTYWTDCDADTYRTSVREEIIDWLSVLKDKNSPDWLIIVVVNDDNRVRSKLLRNSAYDKVKNDFCNKLPDRCIILSEPLKSDAKSSESWSAVLFRMRQLLLESYNRNLDRFEEHMRAQRERRIEPKWSFCIYFLLQEELAFIYEMLRLYEDALVQYDELDALFTQFVVNHAAGDRADWLVDFAHHPTTRWDGLCLTQPINFAKRSMIKRNLASLLDFRNYLFSRQCTLLMLLERPWEIGCLAIPFMHNCIRELKILQIILPEGAIDCWVFLNCLEVLKTLHAKLGDAEQYTLQKATLRDYARNKIAQLGSLCGLMPGSDPTLSQKNLVLELLTGLVRTEGDYESMNKLKEAMSTKEEFYKYYVELSESTMAEFKLKHVGRIRSARCIGKDLAKFYVLMGCPEKAEGFLRDSLNLYKADSWEMLADRTRIDLAECQQLTGQTHKYCRTCMHLASSLSLSKEERERYQLEIMSMVTSNVPLLVRCKPVFYVCNLRQSIPNYYVGQQSSLSFTITSNLVNTISVNFIGVSLSKQQILKEFNLNSKEMLLQRQTSGSSGQSRHSRNTSGASVMGIDLYNRIQETMTTTSQRLDMHEFLEYKADGCTVVMCGVVCRSPLKMLCGVPPSSPKERDIKKENWDVSLSTLETELKPGDNDVTVFGTLSGEGSYLVNQLCIRFGSIEFAQCLSAECISLNIITVEPSLTMRAENAMLVAGVMQTIELIFKSGSQVHSNSENSLYIRGTSGLEFESSLLDQDGQLLLHSPLEPQNEISLTLSALAIISDDDRDCVNHQVMVSCDKWDLPISLNLFFFKPWRVFHYLHTAYHRKYIQIVIIGTTDLSLQLSGSSLLAGTVPTTLTTYNNLLQTLIVNKNQSASFLWELEKIDKSEASLPCIFTVQYCAPTTENFSDTSKFYDYTYKFILKDYWTVYVVSCLIIPSNNEPSLTVGQWYDMTVSVRIVDELINDHLSKGVHYDVMADSKTWCLRGCIADKVTWKDGYFEAHISASPLVDGFIHLPSVLLHRTVIGTSIDSTKSSLQQQQTRRVAEKETSSLEFEHTSTADQQCSFSETSILEEKAEKYIAQSQSDGSFSCLELVDQNVKSKNLDISDTFNVSEITDTGTLIAEGSSITAKSSTRSVDESASKTSEADELSKHLKSLFRKAPFAPVDPGQIYNSTQAQQLIVRKAPSVNRTVAPVIQI